MILLQGSTKSKKEPQAITLKQNKKATSVIQNKSPASKIKDTSSGSIKLITEPKTQQANESLSANNPLENNSEELAANPSTTTSVSSEQNQGTSSSAISKNDMPLKLTIKVKDNVWFNIAVDKSRDEDFILPKGTEKTFYGKDHFLITVGDRRVVDLILNDKVLSLPGDSNNKPQKFLINSQLIE